MTTPFSTTSRRDALKLLGLSGAVALGGPTLLAACSSEPTSEPAKSEGEPKRGGTLRFGSSGGSASDTLDAQNALSSAAWTRVFMLYDPLVRLNPQTAQVELALADSIEPNGDNTVWTIKIKKGIKFHDGRELTSKDVIYSFKRQYDPKAPLPGSLTLTVADVNAMKAVDKYTVHLPLKTPFNDVINALSSPYHQIVPEGYNPKSPVGTGPFKYKSFTPGVESTFVRHDEYWRSGLPYADQIVTTEFSDESSQINALLDGQVDMVDYLSAQSINALTGNASAVVSQSGGWNPITMASDIAPFDDPKVRQAFRLMAERNQMNQLVYGGEAALGNDIFALYDPQYPADLAQREQDVEQARSLLKSAGKEGLTVDFTVADIAQGMLATAQIFAQQAKEAGVTVNLKKSTVTSFWSNDYLKAPLAVDFWYSLPYLVNVSQATLSTAPFNTTHWNSASYDDLYRQATTTKDDTVKDSITQELIKTDFDEGGFLIPTFAAQIDGVSSKVGGVKPAKNGFPMGGCDFASFWVTD